MPSDPAWPCEYTRKSKNIKDNVGEKGSMGEKARMERKKH